MGVWIETFSIVICRIRSSSHTLRGCVDWNFTIIMLSVCAGGHTLRGCVDWNFIVREKQTSQYRSHPAWVCGLKLSTPNIIDASIVTPCVGVWIETNCIKS